MKKILPIGILVLISILTGCGSSSSSNSDSSNTTSNKTIYPKEYNLTFIPESKFVYSPEQNLSYVCLSNKTIGVFDVSNPDEPKIIKNIPLEDNCYTLTLNKNILYAVDTSYYSKLYEINVTDINNPNIINKITINNDDQYSYDNIHISNNYLYYTSNNRDDGPIFHVLDQNLDTIGTYTDFRGYPITTSDITEDGKYEIINNDYTLYIMNIEDSQNPYLYKEYSDYAYTFAKLKVISPNYMIAIDYNDPGTFYIFDISDLQNMYEIAELKNTHNGNFYDFFVDGNYVYVLSENSSSSGNYIDKIDISDIRHPKLVESKFIYGHEFMSMERIGNKIYTHSILHYGLSYYQGSNIIEIFDFNDL